MSDQAPRKIKIACPGCGQKLDLTEMPAFAKINCPSCSFELIVPKWFNNYLLEAPEGSGGMAVVYRALDIALDREVAIKIINPELAASGVSPDLFLHEARIAATINHPAVVPIYSCGEYDGSAYIVMQYMSGGSLEQRLRRAKGRLPIMETCRWIRDVSEGLGAARELGIIHHDVKPANILLDVDSNAKISDFGLSQAAFGKSASAFLDPSKMWLSPQYVSPEKVLTGEEGPAGDVYSLGASFYHLLTGEPPFQAENVQDLVMMRTKSEPASPDLVRPDITPALASVILDMMNIMPEERPSYSEISGRINEAIRSIMRPAAPQVTTVPDGAPAVPQPPRKVFRIPANRRHIPLPRRVGVSHILLILLLLFLVCGAGFLLFLPRLIGHRTLLEKVPALKIIYGDLPPESFSFLSESFYESPRVDADLAFSDFDYSPETRYAAAWVSGVCRLLEDSPSALNSIADMGDHLRSAASLAGKPVPAADAYCLAVLSRVDPKPPDVYFSREQLVRVLLGRFIRSVYDLDPSSLEDGHVPKRILTQFDELYDAFEDLPEDSWLVKLFGGRISDWKSAVSDDIPTYGSLEPLFRRMLSGDADSDERD